MGGAIVRITFKPKRFRKIAKIIGEDGIVDVTQDITGQSLSGQITIDAQKEGFAAYTNNIQYSVYDHIDTGTVTDEPSPTIYQQILAISQNAQEIAQSVKDDADSGKFDGSTPYIGDNGNWVIDGVDTGKLSGGVQPDWDQNDPTAADYVKNRTHYREINPTIVVPHQTVTTFKSGNFYIAEFTTIDNFDTFSKGKIYTVIYNGVSYECIANSLPEFDGLSYIGNLSIAGIGVNTNEPFIFILDRDFTEAGFLTEGDVTFSIAENNEQIHKIDLKYLPKECTSYIIDIIYDYEKGELVSSIDYETAYAYIKAGYTLYARLDEYYNPLNIILPCRNSKNSQANVILFSGFIDYSFMSINLDKYGCVVNSIRIKGDSNNAEPSDLLNFQGLETWAKSNYIGIPSTGTVGQILQVKIVNPLNNKPTVFEFVDSYIDGKALYLTSSTPDSTKKFRITVDDTGTISTTEI